MNTAAMTDIFKMWGDFKAPAFDLNNFFSAQRRNLETLTAANQIIAEGFQNATRRQADLARSNFEQAIKVSREMASGAPEMNPSKQAELAKSQFEKGMHSMREFVEMVTKPSLEAFDLLNKRLVENFEELSETASTATKKASSKK